MTTDARSVRQHTATEVPTNGDAGAAHRAAKHCKHLMESRQTLRRARQFVIKFEVIVLGRNTHLVERQAEQTPAFIGRHPPGLAVEGEIDEGMAQR